MIKTYFYLFILTIMITQSVSTQEDNMELLTDWFQGSYSTTEQSKEDSQIVDMHLLVTPFDIEDQKGEWFYLEFSNSHEKEKPFRQEVYHLYKAPLGFINLDSYKIDSSDKYIGAFRNDSLLQNISIKQLHKQNNCTVYLNKYENLFSGASNGKECQSPQKQANYRTLDIEITEIDFFLWEKGFNTRGKQVWGPTDNGYVFLRDKAKK